MSEPYDNRFDGYLGWNDDEEYAQFQRDYEEWVESHLGDQRAEYSMAMIEAIAKEHALNPTRCNCKACTTYRTSTAHLDAMDRLGRRP